MKNSVKTFAIGSIMCVFVLGIACERKPAEPAKTPPPPPAAPAQGNDTKGLAEFLSKDAATGVSTAVATAEKSADSSLPAGHPPSGALSQMTAQGGGEVVPLKYDAPAEWKSQTPSSAMRKAQFLLPRASGDNEDGQLIVFQFGKGLGGGVDMNIQRWVGMFTTKDGQPIGEDAVKRETRDVGGLKVTTLDISGRFADAMMSMGGATAPKENYRMLAAIVETPDGPWFFKGVGPKATMASHQDSFREMLRTLKR